MSKVLHFPLIMIRWIDQASVNKQLNEVVSIKQTFTVKTTRVKAVNKSNHLKVIGRHFLPKIVKKTFKRSSLSLVKLQLVNNSLQL